MSRYATSTSISLLLPNFLVGNTTTSDTYGADIWSASADRAEGEVNASIVSRYDPSVWTNTGSPAIPPLIRKITEDLACLYAIRAAQVQDSQIKNPNIVEWERAHEILDELQDGSMKLSYTDGSLVPTRSSGRFVASSKAYAHVFNMDAEKSWGVSTDQLDDISTERDG